MGRSLFFFCFDMEIHLEGTNVLYKYGFGSIILKVILKG